MTLSLLYLHNLYKEYRHKSGLKKSDSALQTFVNHQVKIFGQDVTLEQKEVNKWYIKRENESIASNHARIYPLKAFIKFCNERHYTNILFPRIVGKVVYNYQPHIFEGDELMLFFKACDEEEICGRRLYDRLNILELPVFFRLLYSSGMRPSEAMFLETDDIDLNTGIVNIRHTKGYNEHRVVLNDSMRDLLYIYNLKMETIFVSRHVLFPTAKDTFHCKDWASKHFRKFWYKYNKQKCVVYAFRHNYVIANINSWSNITGPEVNEKFAALSRSLGHTSFKHTMHYYNLVPWMSSILSEIDENENNHIIPDIPYYG